MNETVENIQTRNISSEDAKHPHDEMDATIHKTDFQRSRLIPAVIVDLNPDYSDEWMVDLYGKGFMLPNSSDGPVTRRNVIAHALHSEDWYDIGDKVMVRLMPDNTAWIIHEEPIQLGLIVDTPEGEDDAEGNFYWVAFARYINDTEIEQFAQTSSAPLPDDPEGTGPQDPDAEPTDSINYKVVLAENLSERSTGDHSLEIGDVVTLKWAWNPAPTPPVKIWYFEFSRGGEGTSIRQFKVTAGGLSTVSAKLWSGVGFGGDDIYTIITAGIYRDVDQVIHAGKRQYPLGAERWVEIFQFPTNTTPKKVFQTLDSQGRAVWDYLRAHA